MHLQQRHRELVGIFDRPLLGSVLAPDDLLDALHPVEQRQLEPLVPSQHIFSK